MAGRQRDRQMTGEKLPRGKIHPEMLVGVSAVIIGLCALGVSMYETSLMREEQRSAVIPILELGRSYNTSTSDPSKNRLALVAQNVGIGPARVLDFQVKVDGKPQPTWHDAMRALTGTDQRISHSMSVINGRTIPPDKTVRIFELKDMEFLEEILAELGRLEFEACYCSVFDECWTTKNTTFGASQDAAICSRTDSSFAE